MIKIVLFAFLILFSSSGLGLYLTKKLRLNDYYFFPLGFVAYIFLLQVFYYPIQLFSLSSHYVWFISSAITLILFIYSIKNFQQLIKPLCSYKTIILLFSVVLFVYVFYHVSIFMELSDSQVYLNFICQNIDTEHLNYFNFWTGKIEAPNEFSYLYQGYYHFASYFCWLVNVPYNYLHITGYVENVAIVPWGLGLIYSIISNSFIINVVDYLNVQKKHVKLGMLVLAILFFNYFYWRVNFSFYGNTYRTLIIAMLVYYLYRIYRRNEDINYLILPIMIGSSLAVSSSSLFITFDIAYVLMAYYYVQKKEERAFEKLSIIVSPLAVYACSLLIYFDIKIGMIFSTIVVLYYLLAFLKNKTLLKIINKIDDFLYKYGKYVFLVIFPLFLIVFSFVLCRNPYYFPNYAHYFENHSDYDMVLDPFGLYATWNQRIYLIIIWIGAIYTIIRKKQFISFFLLLSLLIFLNPLTTPAIAKLYSDYVYYRAFDIIFNHFTIMYFVYQLYTIIKNKYFNIALTTILIIISLCCHSPLINVDVGGSSYSYAYNEGKNVNPIFKLTDEDMDVLIYIRNANILSNDHQTIVISQLEGFKTFFPDSYQIFARRQFYDPTTRVNEEFYQIARRHYSWIDSEEPDYNKTEYYLNKYNIDIAIVNYKENFEFDNACNRIMTNIYETENYHVKVRNR